MLSSGQEVVFDISPEKIEAIELEADQMSLHHLCIFHGSKPIATNAPRIGFAMRFTPTHVNQNVGRTFALLFRGHDESNHFDRPILSKKN